MMRKTAVASLFLGFLVSCVRPAPPEIPTLADYSDGVSRLVEELAHRIASRAPAGGLLAQDAVIASIPSDSGKRFDLGPVVVVRATAPAKTAPAFDPAPGFAKVERSRVRIEAFARQGARRRVRLHVEVDGIAPDTRRRRIESRWSVVLRPERGGSGWSIESARELAREDVSAPAPLLRRLEIPEWIPSSRRPADFRNAASPGDHDTGGVGIVEGCLDARPCAVIGGGTGFGVLAFDGDRSVAPPARLAELLGLGLEVGESKSILAADFDRDGIADLLVTVHDDPCRLFRGRRVPAPPELGGVREQIRFEEVVGSGVERIVAPARTAVAFDADRDRRTDLFVTVYGDGSRTGPAIRGRNGLPDVFLRNVTEPGGPIRFADESESSGAVDPGWGLAAGAADYDSDGRVDLYVANDFGRNTLYRNVTPPGGPVRFEDVSERTGTLDVGFGMGVAWADYDADDDLDLHVTNYWMDERWIIESDLFPLPPVPLSSFIGGFAKRRLAGYVAGDSLFRNDGGRFTRTSASAGVADGAWAWGTAWLDVNADALPDLAVANGMLSGRTRIGHEVEFWGRTSTGWQDFEGGNWTIDFGEDGLTGPQADKLFLNLGDGTFVECAWVLGFDTDADLRGLAAADLTGDGSPDLVGGGFLEPPVVFAGTTPPGARRISVSVLDGPTPAVGALVRLRGGLRPQLSQVAGGGSFLSDGARTLDFALPVGAAGVLAVDWPDGTKTEQPVEPSASRVVVRR